MFSTKARSFVHVEFRALALVLKLFENLVPFRFRLGRFLLRVLTVFFFFQQSQRVLLRSFFVVLVSFIVVLLVSFVIVIIFYFNVFDRFLISFG